MGDETFDRGAIRFRPLRERHNRVHIERDRVVLGDAARDLGDDTRAAVEEVAGRMRSARDAGKARIAAFGAHTIKNGLGPLLTWLMEEGWLTHLATNGAGIIHDWEFAYLGESSEDVALNVAKGEFGLWEETGFHLNLALAVGAYKGFGYGEAIGRLVEEEGLDVPTAKKLREEIGASVKDDPAKAAAAADLLDLVQRRNVEPGWLSVPHPYKNYGVQAAAHRLGVSFTGHPMIGHDIIYAHPMNNCASIGRCAERDFLRFVQSVSELDGGVYLSIGSAVMSPMIFEKALSMARNVALGRGEAMENHYIFVADLAESKWDWSSGEPPEDRPEYYMRYNKTFSRMGGTMRYATIDNRDLLLTLTDMLAS